MVSMIMAWGDVRCFILACCHLMNVLCCGVACCCVLCCDAVWRKLAWGHGSAYGEIWCDVACSLALLRHASGVKLVNAKKPWINGLQKNTPFENIVRSPRVLFDIERLSAVFAIAKCFRTELVIATN